jgi:hypothetical protein
MYLGYYKERKVIFINMNLRDKSFNQILVLKHTQKENSHIPKRHFSLRLFKTSIKIQF